MSTKKVAKKTGDTKPKTLPDSGIDAFNAFHARTFGPKRWKSLLKAMESPTDHVAMVNPFVPARWIARELHRIGTTEFTNLDSNFLQELPIHMLTPIEPSDSQDPTGKDTIEIAYGGSFKRTTNRWPAGLPKVGSLPGDMLLDFATLNSTSIHGSTVIDLEDGPNNFGGMRGRCGYYLLDAASLCAPLILNPQKGQRVLDVCAAPGGKSLIMAYLMFGRNQIDKSSRELKQTLYRLRDGGAQDGTKNKLSSLDEERGMALSDDEYGSDDDDDMDSVDSDGNKKKKNTLNAIDLALANGFGNSSDADDNNDDENNTIPLTLASLAAATTTTTAAALGPIREINREQPRDIRDIREIRRRAKRDEADEVYDVHHLTLELDALQAQLSNGQLTDEEMIAAESKADMLLIQLDAAQKKANITEEKKAALLSSNNNDDDDESADEDDDEIELRQRTKLVLNDVSRQRCERLAQVVKDYVPFELLPEIDVVNIDATTCYQFGSITMNAYGRRQLVSSNNTKSGEVAAERTAKRADAKLRGTSDTKDKNALLDELLQCHGEFDRILLDAPCSSDRHIIHSSENMNLWSETATRAQAKRQIQLLRNSVKALKVGGRVVYSTCSLSPYENDGVVATILRDYPGAIKLHKFKLAIGEKTPYGYMILPDQPNCSWGPLYVAALERIR